MYDIREMIEEVIKKQIELGNDKFAIYPAGKMGMIVKEVLNDKLGIKEFALVDNNIQNVQQEIITFDELCLKKEWYVILFSITNKEVKDLLIEGLKGINRPIVDVFCEYSKVAGEIFDFSSPKMLVGEVNKDQMERLFERTSRQWKKLGDTEPYWSVLTHNQFLSKNITEQDIRDFYASGEKRCNELVQTLIRNDIIDDEKQASKLDVTEIGCGCGRITSALGAKFKHVNAYDISPGNMGVAKKYVNRKNVEFHLVKSVSDYDDLPEADVFFTVLVLQHNVPPLIEYMLTKMLNSLRNHGVGMFQVPSYLGGV